MFSVDSHLHVNHNGMSTRDIIKYLDKNRIDLCWLLTWEEIDPGLWYYKHLPIEAVYNAYLKYPSRVIPFYAPDPHKKQAPSQLENWYHKGIRGCGELKATLNWNSDEIRPLLKTVAKLKLPLVFHMEESRSYNIPYSDAIYDKMMFYGLRTKRRIYQIPRYFLRLLVNNYTPLKNRNKLYFFPGYMLDFASLESTLKEYPNVNFVAHGIMFWKYISNDVNNYYEDLPKGPIRGEGIIWRLLSEYPNLYADLSAQSGLNALTRDPQNAKKFLSLFENKILYGTDNLINGQKGFLDSLGLTKSTYDKIYGDNAFKIRGI
jgi:predicted TIM-barrel fold metal-dependent hydrolase